MLQKCYLIRYSHRVLHYKRIVDRGVEQLFLMFPADIVEETLRGAETQSAAARNAMRLKTTQYSRANQFGLSAYSTESFS